MTTEQEAIERFQAELTDVDTQQKMLEKIYNGSEASKLWSAKVQEQLDARRAFAVESLAMLKQQFAEVEKSQRDCGNLSKRNNELKATVEADKRKRETDAATVNTLLKQQAEHWEEKIKVAVANARAEVQKDLQEVMDTLQRAQITARTEKRAAQEQVDYYKQVRERQRGAAIGAQEAMDEVVMLMDKYKANNNGADTV